MIKLIALLLTSAKFGKLLLVVGSMVLSIAAYSLVFGWMYAVGFVLLIFVHEMGHFLAARQRGLAVGAPVFIPFWSFRLMVGMGLIMLAISWVGNVLRWRGRW